MFIPLSTVTFAAQLVFWLVESSYVAVSLVYEAQNAKTFCQVWVVDRSDYL